MKTSDKDDIKKLRILIADDDNWCLDVLVKMLEKLGYDVCAVHDGREAIEAYKSQKNKINLVILDMEMPYNGEKTYTELRKINKNAKILLISGYTRDYKLNHLLEQGNCSFLNKPFTLNSLKMIVSEMTNKSLK
jgi:two-component system cell cycle sensor histidine kinase/response regulator CckA